jgi:DNA-binding transcriptional MerR regulator
VTDLAASAGEAVHYQIGEVARAVGLSLRTIRHYEEVGLIVPSARSAGGFRLYTDRDIERLRRVMGMKPMGFSLEEIRDVLELFDAAQEPGAPREVLESLQSYADLTSERRAKYQRNLDLASELIAAILVLTSAGSVGL